MNTKQRYNGALTREQFLLYEMRIVARLLTEGLDAEAVEQKIFEQNLFQYPTEKTIRNLTRVCLKRLDAMQDPSLIFAIAEQPLEVAKQICLYAMMKENRLVRDFMIQVIGEKFRQKDLSFSRLDINSFFLRLQEQNDTVAGWKESTITRIKQVLIRILVETAYLEDRNADHLNPVWLQSILENAIRSNGDQVMLPAFNCFL